MNCTTLVLPKVNTLSPDRSAFKFKNTLMNLSKSTIDDEETFQLPRTKVIDMNTTVRHKSTLRELRQTQFQETQQKMAMLQTRYQNRENVKPLQEPLLQSLSKRVLS